MNVTRRDFIAYSTVGLPAVSASEMERGELLANGSNCIT